MESIKAGSLRAPIGGLLGAIQCFATGLLWAVIAAGLLPGVLHGPSPASNFSAFAIGVATMIGLRWLPKRRENFIGAKVLLLRMTVGVAVSGLLLGVGMIVANRLVGLLAAATVFEVLFLGLSVAVVLSSAGASRAKVALTNIALVLLFLLFGLAGNIAAKHFYALSALLLSFTAGALLFFVTDEFLGPAQRRRALLSAAMFCLGFLAALVINITP